MRDETVARNYAEVLFDLALRHEGLETYADAIGGVARMIEDDPKLRLFLETPRIDDADKKAVVRKAFSGRVPKELLQFLLVTIDKRRQRLLRDIAAQFEALVDEHMGREHVEVTLAHRPGPETEEMIARRLSALIGRTAIPHVRVDPDILGGIVVKSGDTIYDGSVRSQLAQLRRNLMHAELPAGEPA